ncbi:MAG: carboxypeptidase-like regulatory domain-containing protein [Balneola sp.]|nr:MAG: carboxypeptidase-like regulatory domain-containing protein [Balneola sp.]
MPVPFTKKLLFFFGILIIPLANSYAFQSNFSGKIIDKDTKEPIAGANIYFSGTTIGDASDADGSFLFEAPLQGRFNLIISFIGYKKIVLPILVKDKQNVYEEIEMEADIQQMQEIQVTSKDDRRWRKAYRDFKEFFLGRDEFAYFCEIKNPYSLDFEWNSKENIYTASSSEPLIIENKALGYQITVEIVDVFFNPRTNGGYYVILPRFEEIVSPDSLTMAVWNENRRKTYLGSSRHFFKSLVDGEMDNAGFSIVSGDSLIQPIEDQGLMELYYPNNWQFLTRNYTPFKIDSRTFKVGYDVEFDRKGRAKNRGTLSTVDLRGISDVILVDRYGEIYNPEYIQFFGKWESDRFARHLPLEYGLALKD